MIFLTECRDYFTSNLYESAINNNIPARTNIFSPGYNWWVAIQWLMTLLILKKKFYSDPKTMKWLI